MKPILIKLGGAALTDPEATKKLAEAIVLLKAQGEDVVVVHGGGPMINKHLTENKISWTFFEGQRVTTKEMMSVIEVALGEVNHMICEVLSSYGLSCVGIPGNTNNMFYCRPMSEELGLVGEVIRVDPTLVHQTLEAGLIPVIAPIGVDEEGVSYNLNADWGASTLASALMARALVFATDQYGILDVNGLPYDTLTLDQLRILMEREGVTGGMLAKSRSIERAILNQVPKVSVVHALEMRNFVEARSGGTLCVQMSRLDHVMSLKERTYAVS
jgi:acetylglutamate kinase